MSERSEVFDRYMRHGWGALTEGEVAVRRKAAMANLDYANVRIGFEYAASFVKLAANPRPT